MTMQAFHKWLSSTAGTSQAYRRHLARLTRATRAQLLKLRSDDMWYLWNATAANA